MPGIYIGNYINKVSSRSWTQRWLQTNPDTDVATYQLDQDYDIVTQHTLFGANADMWDNNIKFKTSQSVGGWIFSFVDVRVLPNFYHGNNPINNRAWGLIDSTNQNGVVFFRASGNTANISYKVVQSGDIKYTYDSDIANFAQVKILINSSNEIKVYQLVNDAWVQIGDTQTYDLGSLTLFMATGGTNATKTTLSDWHLFEVDTYTSYPESADAGYLDVRDYGAVPDNSTSFSAAVNDALADGNVVIKNGIFRYTDSIKIPSNRTVLVRNAKIVQEDTNYDNFFRNSDLDNGNEYIKILGKGCAVLDGNFDNNSDDYATYGPHQVPPTATVHRYFGVFFCQVDNFEFKNITYVDYMHWSTCLQSSSYGVIDNIYFSMIKTGNFNQDGIVMTFKNHHHTITNLRGYTGDDFLAMSPGANINMSYPHEGYKSTGDLYSNTFTNIWVYRGGQRFLYLNAGDGFKIHDFTLKNCYIDAVTHLLYAGLSVSIVAPSIDEFYNISIDNISIQNGCNDGMFYQQNACKDVTVTNLSNPNNKPMVLGLANWSKTVYNFSVNGVLYPFPPLVTGTVENDPKDRIVLTFDRLMDDASIPAISAFSPSGGKTVESIAVNKSAKTCTILLDSDYEYGNVVTLGYTAPASNKLKGYLSGNVANMVDQAITNNIVGGLPDGAIGQWKMLGDTNDASGNDYHLTNSNGSWTTGRNGGANTALDMVPASSAYIYRDPFTEIELTEFTVVRWFKADALTNLDVLVGDIHITDYTRAWAVTWVSATNSLRFWRNGWNTAGRYCEVSFTDTTNWHCVIISYKKSSVADNMQIQVDGGDVAKNTYSVDHSYTTTEFQCGKRNGPGYFDGKLGDMYFFNRELTPSEKSFMLSYVPS